MSERDAIDLAGGPAEGEAAKPGRKEEPPRGSKGRSRDPKVFVLLRELSEVHLLLDNVSANPSTTVAELTAGTLPPDLPANWIERVCEISWPPDGSNEERAEDAALLIRAKDYLNRLSHPASGSTIAFTLLVTQEDMPRPRRWWSRAIDGDPQPHRTPTRSSLAQTAYPDLIGKAAGFRRWISWVSIGLVLALILTCALSWFVAYGNAALGELVSARTALTAAQERIDEAESGVTPQGGARTTGNQASTPAAAAGPVAPPTTNPPATPGGTTAPPAAPPPFVRYCDGPASAVQRQLCDARVQAVADKDRVEERLRGWLCHIPFSDCENTIKAADAPSRAVALLTIMGSAVLPFLYGLLGAGAAVIRSISNKIRQSLLSPRDLHLSLQQLALGAVVGACIGLFIAAPSAGSGRDSLLGPVALSASAVSFVAGFGVDAVFQALEALISRIFNLTPAPTANRGDGVAGN